MCCINLSSLRSQQIDYRRTRLILGDGHGTPTAHQFEVPFWRLKSQPPPSTEFRWCFDWRSGSLDSDTGQNPANDDSLHLIAPSPLGATLPYVAPVIHQKKNDGESKDRDGREIIPTDEEQQERDAR
ncbi:hypothetical protein LTR47_004736 [Exophiala xenobiotica]|nr:hypothetical protein LTR41_005424 [Exophiala xenobiotica]KAK5234145.1 hypothetical protein LTR47_004736 [Exophiala xenobiotica]KAK5253216.1 hypothetical protein LTS06_002422 [Exophiala xenobiotica]KAK5256252.1 hypothetical protein LTR40_010483 [Exophiala xenobiotica]KAK5287262.1 hypothetical protein LTR14_009326 [Exophiala xenobiotica]